MGSPRGKCKYFKTWWIWCIFCWTIYFNNNDLIYINVGGQGNTCTECNIATGGYNGGGAGYEEQFRAGTTFSGGGGATHISKNSGLLKNLKNFISNIFIVSGGGAGNWQYPIYDNLYYTISFGEAGGIVSPYTYSYNYDYSTKYTINGANQTTGFMFGEGGYTTIQTAGAGGGWYGGNTGYLNATGGSSYIGNPLLTDKAMYCYNCTESNEESTKTVSTTCHSNIPTENCAKEGNGYARITLVQSNTNVIPPEITEDGEYQYQKTISVTKPGEANSGVKYYEYFVTQENITPTNETIPTGTTDNEIEINTVGTNYVYYRTVSNIDTRSSWSNPSVITIYKCKYNSGQTWNFDYTGGEQEFTVPCEGTYKLEAWGAQGGQAGSYRGGFGAYSTGDIYFNISEKLYVVVGGQGESSSTSSIKNIAGGYNGGGYGRQDDKSTLRSSGGGGATHIARISGLLANLSKYKGTYSSSTGTYDSPDIIIVSGGGAGGYGHGSKWWYGNSAGGYYGGYSYDSSTAGTQNSGYAFGQASDTSSVIEIPNTNHSGGGGGWYGGLARWGEIGSGGGSSYIGSSSLSNKSMYCYNCEESNEESTKTVSTTCTSSTPTANCSKQGNGYARITLVSID